MELLVLEQGAETMDVPPNAHLLVAVGHWAGQYD